MFASNLCGYWVSYTLRPPNLLDYKQCLVSFVGNLSDKNALAMDFPKRCRGRTVRIGEVGEKAKDQKSIIDDVGFEDAQSRFPV